jgi:hypothetical protein
MRDATTCRGVETESSFVPIRHRGAIQQRLLSLVGASALMLMACDAVPPGVPLQISGSGSAASARDRQAPIPRRAPGDSALQVTFAPGTTSRLLEGTLDAGREAEFVVSAEGGSVLMASVLGASAAIEASVYRIDTGEEIPDSAPDHSFWIARVPETAGYLIVLHGAKVPTDYTLTVGIPSDSLLDMLQFSPELARVDARGNNSTPRSGPAAKVSTMSLLSVPQLHRRDVP